MFLRYILRHGVLRTAGLGVATVSSGLFSRAARSDTKNDVFISHAGEQKRAAAEPLYEKLTQLGLRVFIDYDSLPRDNLTNLAAKEMLENARTCPVGVFVVSKDFLTKKWPTDEAKVFLERSKDASDNVRLIPLFWSDGAAADLEKDLDKIEPAEEREKAKAMHRDLSEFAHFNRISTDNMTDLVALVADQVVSRVTELDVEQAKIKLAEAENHITNIKPPQKPVNLPVEIVNIASEACLQPNYVMRHVLCGVPASKETAQALGAVASIQSQLLPNKFALEWRVEANGQEAFRQAIISLARDKLGLGDRLLLKPSHGHTDVSDSSTRRVFRLLAELPEPWMLVVSPSNNFDPNELDQKLPGWREPTKAPGLVLVTSKESRFPTRYSWSVYDASDDSGSAIPARNDAATLKEAQDLYRFQSSRLFKDAVSTLMNEFSPKGVSDAEKGARIYKWAEDLRAVQRGERLHVSKDVDAQKAAAEKALLHDDYRRVWKEYFSRLRGLCEVGNVSPKTLKDLEIPGTVRILQFLQVCEAMDEANYRVVLRGDKWTERRPKVYDFVRNFLRDSGGGPRLERAGLDKPLPFGGPAAKSTTNSRN